MTSVTQTFGLQITILRPERCLRKISQALAFHWSGGCLSDPVAEKAKQRQAEHDRLLHRQKGLSGTQFAGIGIQFALTIILFALAGIWLDRRLETSPVFVLVMVFGGSALAFWSMVRRARVK
jgi:F0F1-type ATP synthase assembly protein I